jgi:hypothetical protein
METNSSIHSNSSNSSNNTNALWASAFVLMGLILFASSKHTPVALAVESTNGGGFTMVTTPGGQGTDLVYVIDDQNSLLMVYGLQDPQGQSYIKPIASWSLPAMFSTARQ